VQTKAVLDVRLKHAKNCILNHNADKDPDTIRESQQRRGKIVKNYTLAAENAEPHTTK
jgi:hypothetical protein